MPKLIIITGPPGVGKSTIALEIAKRFNKPVIVFNIDAFLIGINFFKIKQKELRRIYIIKSIAKSYLSKDINVIIEGLFGGKHAVKGLRDLEKLSLKHKSKFFLISLHSSFKESYERVRKRKGHMIPKPMSRPETKKWHDYFYISKNKKGLHINTNKMSKQKIIKTIMEYISGKAK